MTTHRYEGEERRVSGNSQTFRIPAIVLITAFVLGLLGVAGWANSLEQRKADRTEMTEFRQQVVEMQRDIKELLRRR